MTIEWSQRLTPTLDHSGWSRIHDDACIKKQQQVLSIELIGGFL